MSMLIFTSGAMRKRSVLVLWCYLVFFRLASKSIVFAVFMNIVRLSCASFSMDVIGMRSSFELMIIRFASNVLVRKLCRFDDLLRSRCSYGGSVALALKYCSCLAIIDCLMI